ncbi:MAG: hypothetical protein Kow00106_25310 [Anaerolineae bacterium]
MGAKQTAYQAEVALCRSLHRILMGLALVLLLGHLAIYIHYAVGLMRFPFDYDQGEGFELVDTLLFSKGEWPYRDNEAYPFYASNYPPLFHVLLVPFAWAFGAEYWYGRLAGFVGTLITAGTIGAVVYREERHRAVAALAGLAFLASNYIYHIGPLFRQHMTMVMFETLAVAVLATTPALTHAGQRRRTMAVGLLLLLAAGYTKQHAIATCVAVFAFLFLRNPRRALIWGAVFAAIGGGLFLWINWATDGAWWTNVIAANVNEYYPAQYVGLLRQWLRLHGALILPAALFALYELYFARLSLYTVWWIMAVLSTVLAGKWGAGDSYFATAIAATCILAGLAAGRTLRGGWAWPENALAQHLQVLRYRLRQRSGTVTALVTVLVPILFIVYALSVIKMPTEGRFFGWLSRSLGLESSYGARYAFYDSAGWTQGYASIGHVPSQSDIENGWRIVDIVRASNRPVLSEEAAFSLRAGKDVITNPTQLKNLYENGLFDPTSLVEALRAQEFGAVIFRAQFYPPPVLDAVYEAYFPAQTIPMNGFAYEIWLPGPPVEQRAALAQALEAMQPGQTREIALTLPFDQALAWRWHALTYHGWEAVHGKPQPSGEEGTCMVADFRQGGRTVTVELCPDGAASRLILSG